jgi:hypothetical protein
VSVAADLNDMGMAQELHHLLGDRLAEVCRRSHQFAADRCDVWVVKESLRNSYGLYLSGGRQDVLSQVVGRVMRSRTKHRKRLARNLQIHLYLLLTLLNCRSTNTVSK